jgi:HAD superfamily hydrolase (TIGR01549 family)
MHLLSKKLDVVLSFDVGGTLIYGNPIALLASLTDRNGSEVHEAWNAAKAAVEHRHEDADPAGIVSSVHGYWPAVYRLTLFWLLDDKTRLDTAYQQLMQARRQHSFFAVRTGVTSVLQWLYAMNYRIIVSSNWTADLDQTLHSLGIRNYFAAIYTSAALGLKKPHPEFYETISDLEDQPIWHFGDDEVHDLKAPRQAGWHAFLIDAQDDFKAFFRRHFVE